MNILKLINIVLLGLLAASATGCATSDPYHQPQANTSYGKSNTVFEPGPDPGMDIMESYKIKADRIPTNHQMVVTWDLQMSPMRQARPEQRRNCEVLIKPKGSLNFIVHKCDEIKRMGSDRLVVFDYNGARMAINLSSQPGGYVQNGFCESGYWSPGRSLTVPVVWSTHNAVKSGGGLRQIIGCR